MTRAGKVRATRRKSPVSLPAPGRMISRPHLAQILTLSSFLCHRVKGATRMLMAVIVTTGGRPCAEDSAERLVVNQGRCIAPHLLYCQLEHYNEVNERTNAS